MEIKSANVQNYRNAEHFGFMYEVREKLERFNPEIPSIKSNRFYKAFDTEDVSYRIVEKMIDTEFLSNLDTIRDSTTTGFITQVRSFLKHFDVEKQNAAKRILIEWNACGDLRKKGYASQTAETINFLQVLRGKLQNDIIMLNLYDWVNQMEHDNSCFMSAYTERQIKKATKDELTRLKECRTETDAAYRDIVNFINAAIIVNGEEHYKAFVYELNVSIKYYNDTLAIRYGRYAANNDEEKETPDTNE